MLPSSLYRSAFFYQGNLNGLYRVLFQGLQGVLFDILYL